MFTAVGDEFVRVKEHAPTPSKVRRFTLCSEIEDAIERGDNFEIRARPEIDMDVESKVDRLPEASSDDTSETRSQKTPTKDKYEEVADDEPVGNHTGAIGTSDEHGGGWNDHR